MHVCGYHTHLVCSGIRYSLNDVVCAIDLLLELDHRCRSVICVCVLRTSPWRSIVIPEQINGIVVFQDIPHATNVVDVGHALVRAPGRPMPLFDMFKRIPTQYMLKSGHINTCCILHIMGRSFRNFCDWHPYTFLVVRVLKRFPLVHKCDQRGIDRILVFVDDRLFLRRMPRRICIDRCASCLPRGGGFLCLFSGGWSVAHSHRAGAGFCTSGKVSARRRICQLGQGEGGVWVPGRLVRDVVHDVGQAFLPGLHPRLIRGNPRLNPAPAPPQRP